MYFQPQNKYAGSHTYVDYDNETIQVRASAEPDVDEDSIWLNGHQNRMNFLILQFPSKHHIEVIEDYNNRN